MKKIEAIIQPLKLDEVKRAMQELGIEGMTISGRRDIPKFIALKLEMIIPHSRSEQVIKALSGAARTGKIGDGKIFVYEVAEAIRIRNDERGEAAL